MMNRLIIAHRGARLEAPENTAAAFDRALRYPIDGIEFDVQMSRDGHLVLFHDASLKKINGSRRSISDLLLSELESIDWGGWFDKAYSHARIMRFKELLRRYTLQTNLFIEIKSRRKDQKQHLGYARLIAAKVLAEIQGQLPDDRLNSIKIISFDVEVLRYFFEQASGLSLILNIEDISTPLPDFDVEVGMPIGKLTKEFVDKIHGTNRQVMAWSCNHPTQIRKALGFEIDMILTDDPHWLTDWLDKNT